MQNFAQKRGLFSLIAIIIVLSSILAGTIYYEKNITANVIRNTLISNTKQSFQIKSVEGIKELNQLNEGWYKITNGFVYYLETFDSYVPLYIKVKNPEQQNGFLVVDHDGNIRSDKSFDGLSK